MSTVISMRKAQLLPQHPSNDSGGADLASGLIRVFVLDHKSNTVDHIENALWVWPHKISVVTSVDDAQRLCWHLAPLAIIAGVDCYNYGENYTIPALRKCIPNVPIIALGSRAQFDSPGKFLNQGADALLIREEAHLPTLRDLLMRVQPKPDASSDVAQSRMPALSLPWSCSEMIGALICDVRGSIVDTNHCLAKCLGYSQSNALVGKRVQRDLLSDQDDWTPWKQVAGDTNAYLHQYSAFTAKNGQLLWMQVDVTASPSYPSHLQAVFVHRTKSAMLAGRKN